MPSLRFPILLWRDDYTYFAPDNLALCTHPRGLFAETRQRALSGEFRLADSAGVLFTVTDFRPIPPFGGWMRIPHALLRSVFAEPVLAEIGTPTLPEFIATVAASLHDNHEPPSYDAGDALVLLRAATSAEECLQLVQEHRLTHG